MFIPPVMTKSAQAKSASVTSVTFRSISRHIHPAGSMAATVNRPRGMAEWRAPPTLQTALLFQKVATGNCGDTRRTLHRSIDIDCHQRAKNNQLTIAILSEDIAPFRLVDTRRTGQRQRPRLSMTGSGKRRFTTLHEAKVLIENWCQHYNAVRPRSSRGYRPACITNYLAVGP